MTDPPELAALHARCFTSPRPWLAREFAALLGHASIFLCHAPQGFLLGRVVVDEAELLTLAVTPEARRQEPADNFWMTFMPNVSGAAQ